MKKVKIVTDSSCTMESGVREKLDITVICLSVMVDGVIYVDDEHLSGARFMEMMKNSKTLPKTSQPPIGEFVELYDELGEDGSSVISIHMTELLSGTVNAARQAAQLSNADVTVIDSTFTDQSLAFLVEKAAQMSLEGASKDEIIETTHRIINNSKLYIGIAHLDNLVKGGRVSRVAGMLSNIFNMKVVMELTATGLEVRAKGRGMKTFHKWFEECKNELKKLPNVKRIGISYAGHSELPFEFKESLQQIFKEINIPVLHTNAVIATHAGEGAFAIMYYTD